MASALTDAFTDFVTATGKAVTQKEAINEAQLRHYLLRRLVRGKGPEELMQGGQSIIEQLMFDEQTTAKFVHPKQTIIPEDPQVLEEINVHWRFLLDYSTWTAQEIELNAGGLGRGGMFHQFKRLKRVKEMRVWTSILNTVERQLFAVPETANMEANTGKQPYSIPAFINEQTDGLFYKDSLPTGKTAWTAVEGLDPTTIGDNRWRPQQIAYTSAGYSDSGTVIATNITSKFDEMFVKTQFVRPPSHEEYFTDPQLYSQFIACSEFGLTTYIQQLRAQQDTFVAPSRQDPAYMNPKAYGIDLVHVSLLDTQKLYAPTGSGTDAYDAERPSGAGGTGSGDDATNSGPRYYWINGWYMKPVFHTTRYMFKHPVKDHPNQPNVFVQYYDCWYNFLCLSRQRQGIVFPNLDLYAA